MSFDFTIENGDIKLIDGQIAPIFNEKKLIQDVLKAIFTPTGSNKLHPWYGSPLVDNSVGNVANDELINLIITNGITYALKNIQTLQESQAFDGQYLTPKEVLKQINEVVAYRDQNDKRNIIVLIKLTTRSGTTLEEGFNISI